MTSPIDVNPTNHVSSNAMVKYGFINIQPLLQSNILFSGKNARFMEVIVGSVQSYLIQLINVIELQKNTDRIFQENE